jgi:hypothetical protein
VQIASEILASLCRERAGDVLSPLVWRDMSFDKTKLLWGLCGVESSFGFNCNPRHELGYCFGSRYFNPLTTSQWGCLAHCSYGPWQVMYGNFPKGVSPLSLVWDSDGRVASELCIRAAIGVLNRAIGRGAKGFAELVVAYNGPDHEESYAARLADSYEKPIPESAPLVTV